MIEVFIEAGPRRVFASALAWPGWARSGKTEELALAALADYRPRYAPLAKRAGLAPPAGALAITERHAGLAKNADFGSLGEIAPSDARPLTADEGARIAALLEAAWAAFAEVAEAAPAQLRKGPRGGGRDTAQIIEHVFGAEAMYARKMGLPRDKLAEARPDASDVLRRRITAELRDPAGTVPLKGATPPMGATPPKAWPLRTAARRITWHVLDHLWEIEDKSEPG